MFRCLRADCAHTVFCICWPHRFSSPFTLLFLPAGSGHHLNLSWCYIRFWVYLGLLLLFYPRVPKYQIHKVQSSSNWWRSPIKRLYVGTSTATVRRDCIRPFLVKDLNGATLCNAIPASSRSHESGFQHSFFSDTFDLNIKTYTHPPWFMGLILLVFTKCSNNYRASPECPLRVAFLRFSLSSSRPHGGRRVISSITCLWPLVNTIFLPPGK